MAWFLASYARDARARIEESDLPALGVVREALEEALGIQFEGERGEHFFRSTLVQTLFYGVFSAWVLWSREPPRRRPRRPLRLEGSRLVRCRCRCIRALFEQVATPGKLEPLRLVEVLDWAAAALNRVDRAAFFSRFEETHAVQYFYEPFLEAFDPELRKELGVWYTPPEIVQYMVARVDTVLREELDIADGLADPRVYVLDPCCGTGAYLVEVLERIAHTLDEKGGDALDSRRPQAGRHGPASSASRSCPRPSSSPTAAGPVPAARRGALLGGRRRAGRRLPHQRPHRLGAALTTTQQPPALPRAGGRSATPPRRSSATCRSW